MREMICGIEIESGLHVDRNFFKEKFSEAPLIYLSVILDQIGRVLPPEWFVREPPPSYGVECGSQYTPDVWLRGGARCYKDQELIEYASAECGTFRDLVRQRNIGERLLLELVLRAKENLVRAPYCYSGPFAMYADNVALSPERRDGQEVETTHGCHENYLLRRDLMHASMPAELALNQKNNLMYQRILDRAGVFYAALPVLGGTGHITLGGDFVLSPRVPHIGMVTGATTTSSRTIVNTRDEPHANQEKFLRLHHIGGDTNLTDHVFEMKVAFTYWVLRLIERGWAPPDRLLMSPAQLQDCAAKVNHDPELRNKYPTASSKELSAVDILAGYLYAVGTWRRTLLFNKEDDAIFLRVKEYLEKARHGPRELIGTSEWATKRFLLVREMEKKRIQTFDDMRLRMISTGLHNIDPDPRRNPFAKLRSRVFPPNMDIGDIKRAAGNAPRTRAFVRGLAIFLAKKYGIPISLPSNGWEKFTLGSSKQSFTLNGLAPWKLTKEDIVCLVERMRPHIIDAKQSKK